MVITKSRLLRFRNVNCFLRLLFSLPEPKAQMSLSDHHFFIVVAVVLYFSYFHLLLQNYYAHFKQTKHKVSLGDGDSSLFK